ncbi:unnamed protein product [Paramecium pentaurelia]|uniref:Tetrapyrrole methylase domain-containing protein n=1 Tax=Paramecium pentaurelia TaxID=43138 RepID=A0A8S1V1U8_9CILI|nr:unnamed protein product [Paramecium pentaurelia]
MIRYATRLVRQFSSKIDEILEIGQMSQNKGTLTICPTPIGNFQDWSVRQNLTIFGVDIIACQDINTTGFFIKNIRNKDGDIQQMIVPEDFKECDLDEDDIQIQDIIFKSTNQLKEKLPELNKEFITSTDFKFYKQKKLEELKEQQGKLSQKQKDIQEEQQEEEINLSEFEVYGLSAPLMMYLRNKVAQAKKQKGRGLIVGCINFNDENKIDRLIAMMKMGLNIALVCNSGTPAISDNGFKFVNKCIEKNVQIEVLPGASAISVALSACGFPADNFTFLGVYSIQESNKDILTLYKKQPSTIVLFESPNRIHQTILKIEEIFGENQQVWIGFDLTKQNEKKIRGKCREIYEQLTDPKVVTPSQLKGEITIIISPYTVQYNEDLRAQQILQEEKKNGNKDSNKDEQEQRLVKKVECLHLARVFGDKIKDNDNDLNEILQKSLMISKQKASQLVQKIREQQKNEENINKIRESFGVENRFQK